MKNVLIVGLTSLLLMSCGGNECLTCSRETYWNGIEYVTPPKTIFCQDDDETDAEFEIRFEKHKEKGYYCIEK